jgi:glutaconate CoA-transferase subunit B
MPEMTDAEYEQYLEKQGLGPEDFTTMELLAVATSRETPDHSFIFAGTGLPLLGSMLAQKTTAPHCTIIMEAGIVGPRIEHLPIAVSDPRGCLKASTVSNMADTFGTTAQRGYCTVGILGGAECDRYGNLNSTAIGGYWPAGVSETGRGPAVRFAGSGGANNIATLSDLLLVMMVHEKRRFPERAEYITSIAGMRGPKGERKTDYGLTRGGALVVISDLCILRNNPPDDPELRLDYIFPGAAAEMVKENTGWDLDVSAARELGPPTYEELKTLRAEVDPERIYLGRKSRRELAEETKA